MKKLSSAAIPDSIRGADTSPAPHPLNCHSARPVCCHPAYPNCHSTSSAESSNKKIIGVFECLGCHEEFQLEISKAEIDDHQHCPFCDCLGELNHVITERAK